MKKRLAIVLLVLGLAAAGSSKSNPLQVALVLVVLPALPLLASVLLFTRTSSASLRVVALLVAAAPLLIAVTARTYASALLQASMNEQGEMTWYRPGPEREIAEAIKQGKAGRTAQAEGADETAAAAQTQPRRRSTSRFRSDRSASASEGSSGAEDVGSEQHVPTGSAAQ